MRKFKSGATRDEDLTKLDYEGFISPIVLQRYAQYMQKHRIQKDKKIRASDNWQLGIPADAYVKSLIRHTMDVWLEHRGYDSRDGIEDALCGVMFNAMGYLFELLQTEDHIKAEFTKALIRDALFKMNKTRKC